MAKVELTRDRLYSPEADVLSVNPGGRVPTLALDDGTVLTESKLILDFIHAQRLAAGPIVRDDSHESRPRRFGNHCRHPRPRLAAWFDATSERPSFQATMPPG